MFLIFHGIFSLVLSSKLITCSSIFCWHCWGCTRPEWYSSCEQLLWTFWSAGRVPSLVQRQRKKQGGVLVEFLLESVLRICPSTLSAAWGELLPCFLRETLSGPRSNWRGKTLPLQTAHHSCYSKQGTSKHFQLALWDTLGEFSHQIEDFSSRQTEEALCLRVDQLEFGKQELLLLLSKLLLVFARNVQVARVDY